MIICLAYGQAGFDLWHLVLGSCFLVLGSYLKFFCNFYPTYSSYYKMAPMKYAFMLLLLAATFNVCGQSKSITRFRSSFKETSNMFFYSSTLKMLNTENNQELADIFNDIEEIRVLNYSKASVGLSKANIAALKKSLTDEEYRVIMMINEKGNLVNLYNREKRGKTVGFVAVIESQEGLVLIDLIGSIDVKKFMALKEKIDLRIGNAT